MQPSQLFLLHLLAQRRIEPLTFAVEAQEPASASLPMGVMLAISVAVVAVALGVWWLFRRVAPQTINDGKLLFAELCRANHLSRRQRKLLLEMASKNNNVKCPSQMLLDVSLWSANSEQPIQSQDNKAQADLLRLRSLLFAPGKSPASPKLSVRV